MISGKWPTARSREVAGGEGETWFNIDMNLRYGYRVSSYSDMPMGCVMPRRAYSATTRLRP
ncbi:MAG TPA: hypothetical protein PK867_25645 [Pirellulales bacterium]|nr:hypothetical protein [Pirellulales bacterium]